MPETEFNEMRIGTFFLKLRFFLRKRDEESRLNAELVRYQTWHLLNIQIKREDRIKKPSNFWQFSWEENEQEQEHNEISQEEASKRLKRLLELHNKKENGKGDELKSDF